MKFSCGDVKLNLKSVQVCILLISFFTGRVYCKNVLPGAEFKSTSTPTTRTTAVYYDESSTILPSFDTSLSHDLIHEKTHASSDDYTGKHPSPGIHRLQTSHDTMSNLLTESFPLSSSVYQGVETKAPVTHTYANHLYSTLLPAGQTVGQESHEHTQVVPATVFQTSNEQPQQNRQGRDLENDSTNFQITEKPFWQQTDEHEQSQSFGDNFRVDLNPGQFDHFAISEQDEGCWGEGVSVNGTSGAIHLVNTHPVQYGWICKLNLTVPAGYYVALRIEIIHENCLDKGAMLIAYLSNGGYRVYNCHGDAYLDAITYAPDNRIRLEMETSKYTANITMFHIFFTSVAHNGMHTLPVFWSSPTAGYITSAGFGSNSGFSCFTNAIYRLPVPHDHILMISFPYIDFGYDPHLPCNEASSYLELHDIGYETLRQTRVCLGGLRPQLFNTYLVIRLITGNATASGFKMKFSFHYSSDAPTMDENGMLDCSKPSYSAFKQHVHCDLMTECVGGEDEGEHCPFSSHSCNDGVAVGNFCYRSFRHQHLLTWEEADQSCRSRGGILAGMRSAEDRKAVKTIFERGKGWTLVWMGLKRVNHSVPHMYWKLWMWADGVVAYNADVYRTENLLGNFEDGCAYVMPPFFESLCAYSCRIKITDRYFCKFRADEKAKIYPNNIVSPDLADKFNTLWSRYPMTECPSGHVTHSFLSCCPDSGCQKKYQASCTTYSYTDETGASNFRRAEGNPPRGNSDQHVLTNGLISVTVSMFACTGDKITVPYSLVCDYAPDCPDGSDESFCRHFDHCSERTCDNGQCFSFSQECDRVSDCQDQSDERLCCIKNTMNYFSLFEKTQFDIVFFRRLPPPTIIDFDGRGNFTQRPMANASEPCPETHFRCPAIESHCLPIYVRCNGVNDCPGREDEEDCDRYMCPGFYRCRGSRICLHANHVCDSWPQCPRRDDELYCDLTCPPGCRCQGRAFVCPEKFPARNYTKMRYLDARHSDMTPADVASNVYLVWLNMAFNNIDETANLTWPNLIHLDLSYNKIDAINLLDFVNLLNLRTLILSGNPLVSVMHGSASFKHTNLDYLDLSKTLLRDFDSSVLKCCPHITELNISHCPIDKLTGKLLKAVPRLSVLDLSDSPVSIFPGDVFEGLNELETLFSANYKLCCKAVLPKGFDERYCFAPQDEISSCDDLLKSNLYRVCLWMFAALAVIGNVGCFIFRFFSRQNSPRSGFNVFVTNLTVADFLMGVYLVIVGVADEVYRGQYVWFETTWKKSTACAVAGFLSLLSSETSAFIICLITLDRFMVLRFPLSSLHFEKRSAAVACGLVWVAGIALTCVPFFPMTPRWDFYGQTGICIPLPITRTSFPGQGYASAIMIYLNFFLFILIASGQVFIYWSVRVNSMAANSTKKSQDLTIARRLFTVAASDFLCWFPIGLLGLLTNTGLSVPSEVNVAMAIVILPLNSALNPFLYTFNVVMEKRMKAREAYLLKVLEKRMFSRETSTNLESIQSKTSRIN